MKTINHMEFARRFIGISEIEGDLKHNHMIMAMLKLDAGWPDGDEVPWCSAFVNFIAWTFRYERSKSLRARSWLQVGRPVDIMRIAVGDVVILQRGSGRQPGPDVIDAPGHVGFYEGFDVQAEDRGRLSHPHQGERSSILLLGGNQGNQVSVAHYSPSRVLGVRRLWPVAGGQVSA